MDTRLCFLLYPEKAAEVCSLSYALLPITSLQYAFRSNTGLAGREVPAKLIMIPTFTRASISTAMLSPSPEKIAAIPLTAGNKRLMRKILLLSSGKLNQASMDFRNYIRVCQRDGSNTVKLSYSQVGARFRQFPRMPFDSGGSVGKTEGLSHRND